MDTQEERKKEVEPIILNPFRKGYWKKSNLFPSKEQKEVVRQKWDARAEKLDKAADSLQEAGGKVQRLGCALTLLFTFPLVGLLFGPVGFAIGCVIGVLGLAGMFGQKKKK